MLAPDDIQFSGSQTYGELSHDHMQLHVTTARQESQLL